MDEIFSHMDGRFEVTLTDSKMMYIVHCAMNKAQERMKTKKGVIERLNEISKFYELAVMQLEGCLSFVQAEKESSYFDSNHEEALADLREIKDRLQRRLEESEMAISKKDKELMERLKNELKLRQALELKEGELVPLGVNIELEETRGENIEKDHGRRNDEDGDYGFCEFKTCVDQQLLNFKERLEPDGEVPHSGIDNKKVEEMGSDIDILKQTLDVAFGKIQSAIFFGQMGPKEQQWKLTTEKDIMFILVRSYMREFQENIEAEVRMQEKQILKRWWEHWSQLMDEVSSLRHELGPFISQNELLGPDLEDSSTSPLSSQENTWQKISQEMIGKLSLEESSNDKSKMEKLPKGEDDANGSKFVAKMVKNHESIIRQKSEELNINKDGIVQEKKASPTKKDKEPYNLKERIQNVTTRLDNLINLNSRVRKSIFNKRAVHEEEALPTKVNEIDEVKKDKCTLESTWEKIRVVFDAANEGKDDKRVLNKEKEDKVSEDTYLNKGECFKFEIEKLIEEDVCKCYLKEIVNEWNECSERDSIENHIREEVYFIVFSEAAKCISSIQDSTSSNKVDEIEGTIREDVSMLIFRQMVEEHNKILEDYNAESLVREEVHQIFWAQTVKNIGSIQDSFLDQLQIMNTESLLKEDVCLVVLRGMLKERKMELDNYCMENIIREQLHQFVMVETLKDIIILNMEVKPPIQDKTMEEDTLSSTMMLNRVHEVRGEEKFIRILLGSLLTCFEAEENLMLSAKSEIKEHSKQLHLGSEREELHEHEVFEDWLTGEEQTFYSLTSKVENALQQLGISKALLSELGTTLGLRLCNPEKNHMKTTTKEEEQLQPCCSVFLPFLNFLQIFTEFEGIVNQKLEIVTKRLERMKFCFDPVIEYVNFLRSKESIFQKAFIRRCQNLRKAELEVDLLGDQVDELLALLEKIYVTLHKFAPALQQHFEVSDILELIKKELTSGAIYVANVVT